MYAPPVQEIYDPGQFDEEIEPTMTEFDDEADMDEGTVIGANTMRKKYNPVPSRAMVE
jgi:hypothetical protein